ncbi:MAG: hypothetical protein Q8929_04890, partial [Bacillota bacterium]|nr:hypothetical protein [Bacillota bacterium]
NLPFPQFWNIFFSKNNKIDREKLSQRHIKALFDVTFLKFHRSQQAHYRHLLALYFSDDHCRT